MTSRETLRYVLSRNFNIVQRRYIIVMQKVISSFRSRNFSGITLLVGCINASKWKKNYRILQEILNSKLLVNEKLIEAES